MKLVVDCFFKSVFEIGDDSFKKDLEDVELDLELTLKLHLSKIEVLELLSLVKIFALSNVQLNQLYIASLLMKRY